MEFKKCPKCGADVTDDSLFCSKCGSSLNTSACEDIASAEKTSEKEKTAKQEKKKFICVLSSILIVMALIIIAIVVPLSKGGASSSAGGSAALPTQKAGEKGYSGVPKKDEPIAKIGQVCNLGNFYEMTVKAIEIDRNFPGEVYGGYTSGGGYYSMSLDISDNAFIVKGIVKNISTIDMSGTLSNSIRAELHLGDYIIQAEGSYFTSDSWRDHEDMRRVSPLSTTEVAFYFDLSDEMLQKFHKGTIQFYTVKNAEDLQNVSPYPNYLRDVEQIYSTVEIEF